MHKARIALAGTLAAALTGTLITGAANAAPTREHHYRPGAQTRGDNWFPGYGNGGYNALHYDIDMSFHPQGFRIGGRTDMIARATQDLSRFSLDLDGLSVDSVRVDGRHADYSRHGHKLVVTPRHGIDVGRRFTVQVRYAGSPHPLGSGPTQTGFLHTDDGVFTVTNDVASDTWFPNDDHPSDKATYRMSVTVPRGRAAIGNGRLVAQRHGAATSTYVWAEGSPMASYLATVDIGRWQIESGRTPSGIPEYVAVDPNLHTSAKSIFTTTGRITDEWTRKFGPYPFDSTGGIADHTLIDGKPAGYSEETQTRPVYGDAPDQTQMSHELAHQWFCDSVSLTDFDDIWLNEGFATWAAWYWDGTHGGTPVETMVRQQYAAFPASSEFWAHPLTPAVHDPGNQPNGARIYFGGAMALQFLRERVGDPTFFRILRTWTADYRHGNATTAQFVHVAEQVTGQDLTGFFGRWVYGTGKPALP